MECMTAQATPGCVWLAQQQGGVSLRDVLVVVTDGQHFQLVSAGNANMVVGVQTKFNDEAHVIQDLATRGGHFGSVLGGSTVLYAQSAFDAMQSERR